MNYARYTRLLKCKKQEKLIIIFNIILRTPYSLFINSAVMWDKFWNVIGPTQNESRELSLSKIYIYVLKKKKTF